MALAQSSLTFSFSTTDANSYTTASVTPTANALVLAAVANRDSGGTPGTITLSGNGLTWVEIATKTYESIATPGTRVTLFRAMGASPSAGAITITVTGASTNVDCLWGINQFTGTDTTGTNGSGAVVQSATNVTDSATSLSATLAALADATNNAVFMAAGFGTQDVITAGTGYTKIADPGDATDGESLGTEFKLPGTTTPSISIAAACAIAVIAIEVKVAGAGGGGTVIGIPLTGGMQELRGGMNG